MSYIRQGESTPGPQEEKVALDGWWMAMLLAFLYALSMIDRNILVHLVEPIKADLGLTDVQIGFLIGPLFSVPLALSAVPLGWAADRLPRRLILCLAVLAWTIATTLFTPPEFRGRIVGLFMLIVPLCGSMGALLTAAISDHIFADPQALGWSLSIISTIGISASLICLKCAMGRLGIANTAQTAGAA